jgi:predicted Fe-Mo cluster-binding NifX family protein
MRIAVPVTNGQLATHFGHCEQFVVIDVDSKTNTILQQESIVAPEHQPGLLPRWLAELGAQVVLAGGMGARAQDLFAESAIKVVLGVPSGAPEDLVSAYLSGTLQAGGNACDH